nr:hypothetical protein [uncultured Campylobacter sp.]
MKFYNGNSSCGFVGWLSSWAPLTIARLDELIILSLARASQIRLTILEPCFAAAAANSGIPYGIPEGILD